MGNLRFIGRTKKPTADEVLQWIESGSRTALAIKQRMARMSVKGRARLRRLLRERAKTYQAAVKRNAQPSRGRKAIRIRNMGLNLRVSDSMRLIPTLLENGGVDLRLWRISKDRQELRPEQLRLLAQRFDRRPEGRAWPTSKGRKAGGRVGDVFNRRMTWDELLPRYAWQPLPGVA